MLSVDFDIYGEWDVRLVGFYCMSFKVFFENFSLMMFFVLVFKFVFDIGDIFFWVVVWSFWILDYKYMENL